MGRFSSRPLHNHYIWRFGAHFEPSACAVSAPIGGAPTLLFSWDYWCEDFGSDGWNRTIDLGVMNPELPSTVTYKNPQMG
jgi:hypothetical protein